MGAKGKSAAWSAAAIALSALFFSGLHAEAETLVLEAKEARPSVATQDDRPMVSVRLTDESAYDFATFTAARVGKQIHVKLDGKLLVSPVINSAITGGHMLIGVEKAEDTPAATAARILSGGKLTLEDEAGE